MDACPLVSLIIPVYNVEFYIENCLLSALNQTYQNIEVILIDDCGPDNSIAIAQQTISNHPNGHKAKILKQEKNGGPSAARNRGIKSAAGEYIYFLDSDDEITIDCISTLISSCENDEVVIGSLFSEGTEKRPNIRKRYIGQDDLSDAFFKEEINLYACNKLLLKDFVISNNLYFPEMLHEDFIWTYETVIHANSISLIPDFTYIYTLRDDSRTRAVSSKNIYALEKSINYIKEDIFKRKTNINIMVFLLKNWWDIKYQGSQVLSYSDFRKLKLNNENFSTKGIKNSYKIKYYILKSPLIIQYPFFQLYLGIKRVLKIS